MYIQEIVSLFYSSVFSKYHNFSSENIFLDENNQKNPYIRFELGPEFTTYILDSELSEQFSTPEKGLFFLFFECNEIDVEHDLETDSSNVFIFFDQNKNEAIRFFLPDFSNLTTEEKNLDLIRISKNSNGNLEQNITTNYFKLSNDLKEIYEKFKEPYFKKCSFHLKSLFYGL